MLPFYEALDGLNPNVQNLAMTVLEGAAQGEKALVSAGRLVWPEAGGFFAAHPAGTLAVEQSGVYTIGGQRVFCELLGRDKRLVICGAGHVSIALIQMAHWIGCEVTVIEDRPLFANNARDAGADTVYCETFEAGLDRIEGDADTYFVIVTRGHRHDQTCLAHIARKPHAYIGMIGSRRRTAIVKAAVVAGGADPAVIEGVYTPIGLDIGAETPEEIAVAILAEIIQIKNRGRRRGGYTRELLRAILCEDAAPKALATIVARRGSAPREVGTKMLLFADGRTVGTIGGGCVEAEVLRKARRKLMTRDAAPLLLRVDMTGMDAEEEGMVCGGVVDILLEVL